MDPKDFRSAAAGRVVRTLAGYHAFLPASADLALHYDNALAVLLSQADAALSELSGLGQYLPNPDLLIAPYSKREAIASSRIEGTRADLDDVLLDELSPERTAPDSDVREVRNYIAAMHLGLGKLNELPIAGRLVRDLHRVLMQGVRGDHATPGEFRRTQNWIGPPGSTLADAAYVPPPPDEMHQCLKQWEQFVNRRHEMPDLVQCAMMHEYFEAIHPFIDGNGRIGRLLVTLFLVERRRLSKPLLYVSHYIEAHRRDYYELLQRVRTDGDLQSWVIFFLTAVRETARAAVQQGQALLAIREECRRKLLTEHRTAALLDHLFVNPYITSARAAERLGVTPPTAMKSIARLERMKLLHEVTGRGWGRVWVARPILDLLEKSE